MDRFIYEINEDNEIRVWDNENPNENDAPFLLQPFWPDGTAWADKDEAESWVALFIDALLNPDSEFVAGPSPDKPKKKRTRPEDKEEI